MKTALRPNDAQMKARCRPERRRLRRGERTAFEGFAFLLLLLFVALFATGCSKEKEEAPAPVSVEASTAHIAPITEHIVADAVLAPIAQAAISPKITAPVKKFYVQRGARVKAGQLLATLENRDLQAAVTDNRGAYDAADAGYQT